VNFQLDGTNLTIDVVAKLSRVADGSYPNIVLAESARVSLTQVRAFMNENWMTDDAPLIYSFNTGTGPFKNRRLLKRDMEIAQRKGILAFCVGLGEPFAEDETRAMMIIRANAIAAPVSGVRPELVDRLLAFLNNGLHPVVPQKGSVGTSGDLAPLAHIAAALIGIEEAEITYRKRRMPARDAITEAGLSPDLELAPKDTSSLMNGATTSVAVLALNIHDARRLVKTADVALALSLEAMRAETAAFDPRLHEVRPHVGQLQVARNVLRLLSGSRRCTDDARQILFPDESRPAGSPPQPRIQDVYSLRCAPQVHGPARQGVEYAAGITEIEINSATGNPLVLPDEKDGFVALACGHFHGQYVAQAADVLGIALADLGSISERRIVRLIDPGMSYGIPRNLATGTPGLDTGYPALQCAMSALVMENRHLATPGSVDSIPGKGNFEDHVSNSTWCARKSTTILRNVEYIVAAEILMATQALSLVEAIAPDHPIGAGTTAAMAALRQEIEPSLNGDRFYATEVEKAVDIVRSGRLLDAVEKAVGTLE
jgi:histidine ammonia-lyase